MKVFQPIILYICAKKFQPETNLLMFDYHKTHFGILTIAFAISKTVNICLGVSTK